jgi:hypothetical protein
MRGGVAAFTVRTPFYRVIDGMEIKNRCPAFPLTFRARTSSMASIEEPFIDQRQKNHRIFFLRIKGDAS